MTKPHRFGTWKLDRRDEEEADLSSGLSEIRTFASDMEPLIGYRRVWQIIKELAGRPTDQPLALRTLKLHEVRRVVAGLEKKRADLAAQALMSMRGGDD